MTMSPCNSFVPAKGFSDHFHSSSRSTFSGLASNLTFARPPPRQRSKSLPGSGAPVLWRIRRNRNDPEDYAKDAFLEDVKGGQVYLFYNGKRQDLFDDIRVDEARWIAGLLSKLSERQVADAFRAANYSPAEVRMLTTAVRERIEELVSIPERAASSR